MTWIASPGSIEATSQALLSWSRTTTPTATPMKTAHRAGLRAVPLPADAATGGAAVAPVASP